MLTALEQGVKGGQWFSLIDKVWRPENLAAAWRRVKKNKGAPGVDHQTIARFEAKLDQELTQLSTELREGRYRPLAVKRTYVPKPGSSEKRPLGVPAVRDRVVQAALEQVIAPIFVATFATTSYGFLPGRDCKGALREVVRLMAGGYRVVVDVDFRKYFDTIPHGPLLALTAERIADTRVLALIRAFVEHGVLEQGQYTEPEAGTPQGGVISPLLANVYLNPLDHLLQRHGYHSLRYADDMVILCRTEAEAQRALDLLKDWSATAGLTLHPEKTRIVDLDVAEASFDFLGYRFKRTREGRHIHFPRPKSAGKLRDTIRELTPRTSGHSMAEIVGSINAVLRGWFNFFKHSYANVFPALDSWIRMRLRSILRKRSKRRGRGRGRDHQRWPNAFFAKLGLFSLATAHAEACQSARR